MNSILRMWECTSLQFTTDHHKATSPWNTAQWWSHILKHMRPVLWSVLESELVSSTLKLVMAMGWEQWFVGSVYYSPRSGWEGSKRRVCMCVTDRTGRPYHSMFTHSKLSWNNSLSLRPNNGAGCRLRAQAGAELACATSKWKAEPGAIGRRHGGRGRILYVDSYTSRGADTPLTGTWARQRGERSVELGGGEGCNGEASGLCH